MSALHKPPHPFNNNSLDLVNENQLSDERVRAIGFVGKSSEVQWLRDIILQLRCRQQPSCVQGALGQVSSLSFYMDTESVNPDFSIISPDMPTREAAGHLLECYISTVQDSFPILPRRLLEDKFDEYFDALESSSSARPDPRWKIVINLVFAIGARYSRLVRTSSRGDTEDHAIYQTRARKLGLVEISPLAYPDVLQIQMTGLLAFYYVSIGHMSR